MENKLISLYQYAEKRNIEVDCADTKKVECFSIMDSDGDCAIVINPFMLKNSTDEKVKLAHELGHCETGAFYYGYSPLQLREQCEFRANLWAIKKLIPKDELQKAVKNGIIELWDLAEYFDVSEDFIKKAIEYYRYN